MVKKTNKTIKVSVINPNEFERIKVDDTKQVCLSEVNLKIMEEELKTLSKKELEYRLEFEAKDKETRQKIKQILAQR